MSNEGKENKALNEYLNENISFAYPEGGQVVEISHSDGSKVFRLLGLVEQKLIHIDIELMPAVQDAKTEIEKLANLDRIKFEGEEMGPYQIEVDAKPAWRYIYRLTEGFSDKGYLDTTMIDTPNGVYRIAMRADEDVYDRARRVLETVLKTLRIDK